jgi:pimeloyl-ACP methyl ester carboxylesterase
MSQLTRRAALALLGGSVLGAGALALVSGRSVARAAEQPLELTTPNLRIAGTLVLPDGKGPFPVALIIAGSGPTDRDGNSTLGITTDTYKLLASALATRGIASVRYDKRGIGASVAPGMKETDLRFDMYVDDAYGWLQLFAADARFGKRFVAGHSEGSLIGMIAGARANVAGYVSLCGAGRPAYAVIHDQLAAQLSPDDLAQADAVMARLRKGEQVAEIPAKLGPLFRASVQPYLSSWFKYDPAVEIKRLRCPTAILGGTADVQVPVSEAQLLFVAAPTAKLTIVDGMSHTLKHIDPAAGVTQQRTYTDPALALDPAVVDAIVSLMQRAR